MKKSIFIFLTALLVLGLFVGGVSAMTGSGTLSDPYKFYNQSDLELLSGIGYASYVGEDVYFELANDINMSGNFVSIGNSSYRFNGYFDGKGHKIIGLHKGETTYSSTHGFFSNITAGAHVSNIDFCDGFSYLWSNSGMLSQSAYGESNNFVIINNVNVYDSIIQFGQGNAGVIFGQLNYGKITGCNVERCIIKNSSSGGLGGIVGVAYGDFTIESCTVKDCIIKGGKSSYYCYIGGIIGQPYAVNRVNINSSITDCIVENCYLYGIYGYGVGGILGEPYLSDNATYLRCSISNCKVLNSTIISTANYVGGIYGGYYSQSSTTPEISISNCVVENCSLKASSYVGGIGCKNVTY